jgi:hypothetical protein
MRKLKIYVGVNGTTRELFRSENEPTQTTHPQYAAAIGPFRTVRAANYCIKYPHSTCQTVEEYETAARYIS